MVLLARTIPLQDMEPSKLSQGLSLFYADLARGKKEGRVTVQPIHKMGGRSVDANQVLGFLSFNINSITHVFSVQGILR